MLCFSTAFGCVLGVRPVKLLRQRDAAPTAGAYRPGLAVGGVRNRHAEGGQLVAEPVGRGPVPGRPGGLPGGETRPCPAGHRRLGGAAAPVPRPLPPPEPPPAPPPPPYPSPPPPPPL